MKQMIPYVVLSLITLVLAAQVVLVLYFVKPEVFALVNPAAGHLRAESPKQTDSLVSALDTSGVSRRDSISQDNVARVTVESSKDSLKALAARLEEETRRATTLEQKLATQNSSADSARAKELKGMAKMMESMSAEDAARILQNLKIVEAKKVLMSVKKKQAGKILSAMEPRVAARMMR